MLVGVSCAALTCIGIQRLGYVEFAELNGLFTRLLHQRRIIHDNIISRRLADDLSRASSVADAWSLLQGAARELGFSYVELRGRPRRGEDNDRQAIVRYSQQLRSVPRRDGAEANFAVALTGADDVVGEVVFRRPMEAPPFHSFPVLIGEVSTGLSRILENCAVGTTTFVTAREHNESEIIAERRRSYQEAIGCSSCGSFDLHRTRTWSLMERLRKNMSNKRPYACEACGWREWIVPFMSAPDHAPATSGAQPDLQALNRAIGGALRRPA